LKTDLAAARKKEETATKLAETLKTDLAAAQKKEETATKLAETSKTDLADFFCRHNHCSKY